MNNRHGLPSRPNFSTPAPSHAGPSQPRPPSHNQQGQRRNRPPANHHHQQQQQHQSYQNQPVNSPSLPYDPYAGQAAYPQYGLPQSPYGMGAAGYQPNLSGGYPSFFPQPMYPQYSNQLSAQALFNQPQQQAMNSGGYSYSSTYTQSYQTNQPPNKRHRPNAQPGIMGDPSVGGRGNVNVGMWRNCQHPGCKFVGPSDKVQIHEEDRHLIFVEGKMPERSEEEERYARRKGPPLPIQGTNILLNTPEELEKWLAERKAKWPSKKRIQEKEEERAAAIARGEVPARGKRRKLDAATVAEEWGREPNLNEIRGDQGRGRGGRGGRGRGRGRGGFVGRTQVPEAPQPVDEGWSRITTLPDIKSRTKPPSPIPSSNALMALEGYNTPSPSGSSDSESDSESSNTSDSDSSSEDESSSSEDVNASSQAQEKKPSRDQKEICQFFKRTGTCRFGNRCKNSHIIEEKPVNANESKAQPRQPVINKKQNHFARPSMIGSLLSNPIQNTISQLSQTIRFLVANNMLEGVELNPGDAQAQEDEKNKIKEIEAEDQ
ncbi:hypothetical protein I302_102290 [Kwoniella bestiolae CBS 10118]|uniref:C3H1-type domain-containing protein n=1 Tax=Kwoniella bestiolae CBS 10118 TaxID=1296100 RepID=A0AAJ8K3B1_9TREE